MGSHFTYPPSRALSPSPLLHHSAAVHSERASKYYAPTMDPSLLPPYLPASSSSLSFLPYFSHHCYRQSERASKYYAPTMDPSLLPPYLPASSSSLSFLPYFSHHCYRLICLPPPPLSPSPLPTMLSTASLSHAKDKKPATVLATTSSSSNSNHNDASLLPLSSPQLASSSSGKNGGKMFTAGIIGAWYCSNIGVLLLNKYLLSNYGFKYPIFLTLCHMIACSLLSYIAIAWMKTVPMQLIRSPIQFWKIFTLSVIFCASVVSGNISLRFLPVSFTQAVGATTPFFTAIFAYFMTFKREAWLTYATLVPVVVGVVIASGGEPSFHLYGFIMCLAATAGRALKSVLQGILLSYDGEKLNSMNLLLYMAPIAVVLLIPVTYIMEPDTLAITVALAREDSRMILLLLFNSVVAYAVNLTNFLVTKHTSALTLQVLGNAKGAVAVVVSILLFRNPVSVTGMLGYTLTVLGVILYGEVKKRCR